MLRQQVLSSYRQLLRTANTAFRNDAVMITASRKEIRDNFEKNRNEGDTSAVQRMLADSREASDFILQFVVQGRLNDRGNYAMKVESHQADIIMQDPADAAKK